MKFIYKILFCSIIILSLALGLSGYLLVNSVFQSALEREVEQALNDSTILRFAFETAALNVPTKYDLLQDAAVRQIGQRMESGSESGRKLRISDEGKQPLYQSEGFVGSDSVLEQITEQAKTWQIFPDNGRYYVQTGIVVNALDRNLYLEAQNDITAVFEERAKGFSVYRKVTLFMILASSALMFFFSTWLTKPIRLLTRATRRMTMGDYYYRARQVSDDELGQLTQDFNKMAAELESTIGELKDEITAREDFIGAFAHELKTPLTAIIGYADLLRSRKLDEEKQFLSANYIYTEGKRLESMSFRLLDIIVTKREQINPQEVSAETLFEYMRVMFRERVGDRLLISFDSGKVCAEVNLIKSVLLNLIDNAFKASGENEVVELHGRETPRGYEFLVIDHGIGIPEQEFKRITEAFYMVDKSRSRSRNGAGLGLALCAEILRLHNSELKIQSEVGKGTCMSFILPDKESYEEMD